MKVSKLSLVKVKRLSVPAHDPGQRPTLNLLLKSLPESDLASLTEHLELVHLPLGDVLYEPDKQLEHAYFPTTAIVSLHYVTAAGSSMETAGVGNEGMVGIPLFMGGNTTPGSAVVRTAGYAYRIERSLLKKEFSRASKLQQLLLRYTQTLVSQICQNAACNRHHSVEQQLCRWLLLTLDRIASGQFVMTQDLVANMLGVQRDKVTAAALHLQALGCISYRRGHISVLDRNLLESRACECYGLVKNELLRLLGAHL